MNIRKTAVLAALPIVLTLGACGNDGNEGNGIASANRGTGKPGGSASPGRSLSPEDAALKFAQCMRDNGVEMEDPVDGRIAIRTNRGDGKKTEDAMKKCEPIMGAAREPSDINDPKVRDRMLKFAQCMRKNGIDVPDPTPGKGIEIKIDKGGKARLEAAQEACKQYDSGSSTSAVRD